MKKFKRRVEFYVNK
jgi:hypothetical protein